MHLHLIAPSNEDSTYIKPLWAATLAAHTPPDVELTFRDDGLDPIDLDKESDAPDLVGISVNSKTAARAYAIADAYRKRGSKVVLGGIHVTALPEEGLEHADAVVSGEAEWIWQKVIEDAKAGKLGRGKSLMNRSIYKHEGWPELVNMPMPKRDLIKSIRYVPFDVVQTTRGCPFPCEFCSVSTYNGTTFRFRPVREVVAELETLGNKILFGDDNVMIHTKYSHELFEAMVPLKKHWVAQASLAALHKVENVEVMARAGCKALFIGFESVDDEAVRGAGKKQNKPRKYQDIVRMLADHGIAVWGSFIFGLDEDGPGAFDRTVEFCIESKITMALFALLTPYPGTQLYKRLKAENRLSKDKWWLEEDHHADAPFYKPARLSPKELKDGWVKAWRQMYSYGSIAKRYDFGLDHSWIQNLAYWPINLMMHELAERKIANGDRAWRKHRALDLPFGL
ncbi:B12-binding domain-containing radical SAM protein [Polyangium aurulentum]|uniref:B12-binding domain-containing radical SAM protein n=1 Tax=Polyangium aurulentum TaxID=2567896 RepID=UPI0010AEC6F2|nr:radical SAM protein [Polyangium aurulentum]UQA55666.1 B12-binding domain-containing radical SAM protein [Polyangium aurulentum]